MQSDNAKPRAGGACLLGLSLAAAVFPHSAMAADAAADTDGENPSSILVIGQHQKDANRNANADAPYKVERSSNEKFTEPVRDTPRSVTIIPKEVIKDIGATSLRDVVRSTPGVTLGTGEGGNAYGDRIFIRGFEARNDVYIDGMRDPGVSSRETFAVEQIEVVKGASSAFGGRGTTGGLVSLESKQALARNFTVAEAGVGTANYRRFTIDANRKLTDNLALRVNGLWHDADTPGRDDVWQRRWGVTAAIHWTPTSRLTLDADYYHYQFNGMSDYGIPFDSRTQIPFAVNPDNFYGAVGRDFLRGASNIGTATLHYQLTDNFKLRSMTRYGTVTNRYVVSVPGRAPDISNSDPSQWTETTSASQHNAIARDIDNITDATWKVSTAGIDHTLVGGFEYAHEQVTNRRYAFPAYVEDSNGNPVATSTSRTLNLFNPNPVLGYTIPAVLDTSSTPTVNTVETFSGYLIDTVKFLRHWEVTGGLRYDNYDIRATGGSGSSAYDRQQTYGLWNWQASLTYKPIEPATLYFSASTSSNPSGEQLDSTSDTYGGLGAGTVNLAPERNHAYEFGAKYELAKGRLLVTAAAFRIDKDNARQQTQGNVYVMVGKLRSQGFELGINGNITQQWAVFGGYTYLDATVIKAAEGSGVTDGARFANIPRHSGSLLTTYSFDKHVTMGAQATYRSAIYGGSLAAGNAHVPGYWRFDAVGRYRFSDDVELRVNVLNLTNKRYFDAIYRSGSPFAYMAPGRSATFTLAAKF